MGKSRPAELAGRRARHAAQLVQEDFIASEDTVFLALVLPDDALAAEPVDIIDRQYKDLGGAEAGMQHELDETAVT